eukprot:jgi/Mesvir1/29493/Mv22979-RA.1
MCSILSVVMLDGVQFVQKAPMSRETFVKRLIPLAMTFSGSLSLGNICLRFVPVSFMQTLKSFTPVTTALLEYALFRKLLSKQQYVALVPVVLGMALTSWTEPSFVLLGFLAGLADCMMTTGRVILQERLLQGKQRLDSFNLIYYLSPMASAMLIPFALYMESPELSMFFGDESNPRLAVVILALSSAVLAFFLNVSIFFVIQYTSGLTFNVLGNLRSAFTILVSWWIFRNPMTIATITGCSVTVLGVTFYGYIAQGAKPPASHVLPVKQEGGSQAELSPLLPDGTAIKASSLNLPVNRGESLARIEVVPLEERDVPRQPLKHIHAT